MTNGILLFTIVSKQRQYFFVYSVYQFNGIYRFLQLIEYYPNFQGTVEFLMAFSRKEKSVNSIENFFLLYLTQLCNLFSKNPYVMHPKAYECQIIIKLSGLLETEVSIMPGLTVI